MALRRPRVRIPLGPLYLSPQRSLIFTIFENGPIAQLGARLNGIEEAEGSNPSGSTFYLNLEGQSGFLMIKIGRV